MRAGGAWRRTGVSTARHWPCARPPKSVGGTPQGGVRFNRRCSLPGVGRLQADSALQGHATRSHHHGHCAMVFRRGFLLAWPLLQQTDSHPGQVHGSPGFSRRQDGHAPGHEPRATRHGVCCLLVVVWCWSGPIVGGQVGIRSPTERCPPRAPLPRSSSAGQRGVQSLVHPHSFRAPGTSRGYGLEPDCEAKRQGSNDREAFDRWLGERDPAVAENKAP